MDFKQIQELIKLINKSNIGEVTIEEKGFKITVKQKEEHIQQVISAPFQPQPIRSLICSACCFGPGCRQQPAGKREIKTAETGC